MKSEFEVGTSVLDGPNSEEDCDAYEMIRSSVQLMQPIESHELPPEFFPIAKQNLFIGITKVISFSPPVDQLIESCSTLGKLKRPINW